MRMSDTRLEMVIVRRSLEAANAIIAGNSISLRASATMTRSTWDTRGGGMPAPYPHTSYNIASCGPVSVASPNADTPTGARWALVALAAGRARPLARLRVAALVGAQPGETVVPSGRHERVADGGEGQVQLRAEAGHDRDDCNRDASRDEAILDGGRARLVIHKLN